MSLPTCDPRRFGALIEDGRRLAFRSPGAGWGSISTTVGAVAGGWWRLFHSTPPLEAWLAEQLARARASRDEGALWAWAARHLAELEADPHIGLILGEALSPDEEPPRPELEVALSLLDRDPAGSPRGRSLDGLLSSPETRVAYGCLVREVLRALPSLAGRAPELAGLPAVVWLEYGARPSQRPAAIAIEAVRRALVDEADLGSELWLCLAAVARAAEQQRPTSEDLVRAGSAIAALPLSWGVVGSVARQVAGFARMAAGARALIGTAVEACERQLDPLGLPPERRSPRPDPGPRRAELGLGGPG